MRRILMFAIVFAAACAGDAGWRGVVRDSAGVAIIENPDAPVTPQPVTVRESLRIGSADGRTETQFGLIASVDVTTDGRIVVLDQQNHQVRVFSPDGEFLQAMGRAGSGPGELSAFAVAAFAGPGDTIVVADPGNRRFQWYADGVPAGGPAMALPAGMAPNRFALLPGLRVVCMAVGVPTPEQPQVRDNLLVRLTRSGAIADTLRRMPGSRTIEFRDGVARFTAYVAEPVWALADDGTLYSAMSDRWRIEQRDSTGALRRVITRDHAPQPVTQADRLAFLNLLRRTLRAQNADPMVIEQMVDGMSFADAYPAFAYFMPGPRGTLWVQRIRTAQDAMQDGVAYDAAEVGSASWDVFDAEGRFHATATLPPRFTPLATRGDRLYGVWRDDLDVQHVLVVEAALP